MMGIQKVEAQLFYEFDLDAHVPSNHVLREIDRFLDMAGMREKLKPFYSHTGRPSIDPELIVRMLVIGYVMGIRSERRLCQEVHLNLAYRWFCRLGLDDKVPDHSSFSRYRHGKFRDSDMLRQIFEATVERCLKEDHTAEDPGETRNLAGRPEHAEVQAQLSALIEAFFATHTRPEADLWQGGRPLQNSTRQFLWRDAWGEDWKPVFEYG